jgi:hypothetical protein
MVFSRHGSSSPLESGQLDHQFEKFIGIFEATQFGIEDLAASIFF